MENKNILVLTTLSSLFLGFIVPLVLWLTIKENFEENQKTYLTNLLNFELTMLIGFVILTAINVIPILGQIVCFLGGGLLWLLNIIILVIATIKLTKDEEHKFPFALELIK